MPTEQYPKFKEILDKDIAELALYELTDYSLLLGVHDPSNRNFKENWIDLWNRSPDQMRLYTIFYNYVVKMLPFGIRLIKCTCSTKAMAVKNSKGEKMIVSMGFIDTLTYYDWKRAAESAYKNLTTNRQATIQAAYIYSARMEQTFDEKFIPDTVNFKLILLRT